jgi:hypothetical protein
VTLSEKTSFNEVWIYYPATRMQYLVSDGGWQHSEIIPT